MTSAVETKISINEEELNEINGVWALNSSIVNVMKDQDQKEKVLHLKDYIKKKGRSKPVADGSNQRMQTEI